MVDFGPLAAEIGSLVWGTPANLNGFHVLVSLLQLEMGKNPHCLGSVLFGFYDYQGSVRFGFLSSL